jgi:hypothetical protein
LACPRCQTAAAGAPPGLLGSVITHVWGVRGLCARPAWLRSTAAMSQCYEGAGECMLAVAASCAVTDATVPQLPRCSCRLSHPRILLDLTTIMHVQAQHHLAGRLRCSGGTDRAQDVRLCQHSTQEAEDGCARGSHAAAAERARVSAARARCPSGCGFSQLPDSLSDSPLQHVATPNRIHTLHCAHSTRC